MTEVREFVIRQKRYKWDEEGATTRYTVNYGWDFAKMENGEFVFNEIPPLLDILRKKMVSGFSSTILKNTDPAKFDNLIVTIYEPGQFLKPHFDADASDVSLSKRTFYFKEPIIGAIISPDPHGGLTFYYQEGKEKPDFDRPHFYQAKEKMGTTFVISGICRHAPYYHAIPPVSTQRISLTIRQTVLV